MTMDAYIEALSYFPQEHPMVVLVFAAALGAMVGSFANVLIYRLPRYCLSIVKPGSHCPVCETPITWYDNIPIFAWAIWLGRKCRKCATPIHWRYPAVEALVALIFALFAWQVLLDPAIDVWDGAWFYRNVDAALGHQVLIPFGEGSGKAIADRPPLVGEHLGLWALWCAASVALLVASWIDAQMKIIPDSISLGGTLVVLLLAPFLPMIHRWGVPNTLIEDPYFWSESLPMWASAWLTTLTLMIGAAAFLYALGLFGTLLAPKEAKAAGGAMGFGDVKLIMLMAGLLGWPKLLVAFTIAVFAGAILGAPRLWQKIKGVEGVRTDVPFGPYLAFGTVVAMLFSAEVFDAVLWYIDVALTPSA